MASHQENHKYFLPSYIKYQFHLIARNDDTAHVDGEEIKDSPQFDFTLKTKLRWSKNVHEEREAPEQIMIGAGDWKFCVLLGLAIHLERCWIGSGEGLVNDLIFGMEGDDPKNAKDKVRKYLKSYIDSNEFHDVRPEPLGPYSIRKCANTYSRLPLAEPEIQKMTMITELAGKGKKGKETPSSRIRMQKWLEVWLSVDLSSMHYDKEEE
jgi:hypothetical protein